MKKRIWMICAAVLVTVTLCACGTDEAAETGEEIGDRIETYASEVKDHIDGMVENGTVSDGDGYIGEENGKDAPDAEADASTPSDDTDSGGGLFDADPTDMGDHI